MNIEDAARQKAAYWLYDMHILLDAEQRMDMVKSLAARFVDFARTWGDVAEEMITPSVATKEIYLSGDFVAQLARTIDEEMMRLCQNKDKRH